MSEPQHFFISLSCGVSCQLGLESQNDKICVNFLELALVTNNGNIESGIPYI
jgi:hypothetical protein